MRKRIKLPSYENVLIAGRSQSWFVYFLLCAADSDRLVYIKIGHSREPLERARALINSCGLMALRFGFTAVGHRDAALDIENCMHRIFAKWRTRGEWFRFGIEEKTVFDQLRTKVFQEFRSPSWPMKIRTIDVENLVRAAKMRKNCVQGQYSRRGRAYGAFVTDCASQ